MTLYRKRPVVIEAIRWTGENFNEIKEFSLDSKSNVWDEAGTLWVETLEGNHVATTGDYIIKGVADELYPCKADIFYQTYEIYEPETQDADFLSDDYNLYTKPFRADR